MCGWNGGVRLMVPYPANADTGNRVLGFIFLHSLSHCPPLFPISSLSKSQQIPAMDAYTNPKINCHTILSILSYIISLAVNASTLISFLLGVSTLQYIVKTNLNNNRVNGMLNELHCGKRILNGNMCQLT